jgi:predicted nucleic acid-binding protein
LTRLFLDANVLFTAAHNPKGKAAFIAWLGTKGAWQVCTSTFAVEEARRNLAAKYPSAEKKLDELLSSITIVREQSDAPYPRGLGEKDRPIFQAAYACRATHLITGDNAHFGASMNKPKTTAGITILTPAQFLISL